MLSLTESLTEIEDRKKRVGVVLRRMAEEMDSDILRSLKAAAGAAEPEPVEPEPVSPPPVQLGPPLFRVRFS